MVDEPSAAARMATQLLGDLTGPSLDAAALVFELLRRLYDNAVSRRGGVVVEGSGVILISRVAAFFCEASEIRSF